MAKKKLESESEQQDSALDTQGASGAETQPEQPENGGTDTSEILPEPPTTKESIEKLLGVYRHVLPHPFVTQMEEILAGM